MSIRITPIKTKRLKRSALEGYKRISAKKLCKRMQANDGLKAAKKANDLTPAIELLYFIHEWCLDQVETEE